MPLATFIQLLAQVGLPLTQQIYTWLKEGKTEVTLEDMQIVNALAKYRSADALEAAGLSIVDGKIVVLPLKPAQ